MDLKGTVDIVGVDDLWTTEDRTAPSDGY
jgi:hypothetical protein